MKKIMLFTVLCLCLSIIASCTTATTVPTPLITLTPIPPTPTLAKATAVPTVTDTPTPIPPTPTQKILSTSDVQETEAASVPVRQPDWTFATGNAIWCPVSVADGVVYFGSDDGYLYAVNAATHDLKWKFKTDGAVRSQPAVTGNTVYIASDDSYLYAVAKSDGSMLWKVQVEKEAIQRSSFYVDGETDWYTSSPILQDTTLYIGSTDGNLYALDAVTGKALWKFATEGNRSIRTTPLVADGVVYFGDIFASYYAIDAKEGTKIWNYATSDMNYATGMILSDQVLYFATSSGLNALDTKTGKIKWTVGISYASQKPAYENGILYGEGYKDGLYAVGAYEAETGKLLWLSPPSQDLMIASLAIGKDTIYYGLCSQSLNAVDKKTGAMKWKLVVVTNKGSGVNSSPAIADGMVYFGGMDGNLYAIKEQ